MKGFKGYTLLDIVVSMAILAFGLLALMQLQGNLSRATAEANERTVAVNLAEEIIEGMRAFNRLTVDEAGDDPAYEDFHDKEWEVSRGGIPYNVVMDVQDYYYVDGAVTDGTVPDGEDPLNRAHSDFKLVSLSVSWSGRQFSQGGVEDTVDLGGGSIEITDIVSSSASLLAGKSLATGDSGLTGPGVNYSPGSLPDVVAIELGNNRFKESTVPLPDVIRADELVETQFDVVTYLQGDTDASFIRREEFRAVSCQCTLKVPTSGKGGLRPTVWNGDEYVVGELVSKSYGESANNQQSVLCDVCCRDHHDGGTGSQDIEGDPGKSQYDPFKGTDEYHDSEHALAGNHKHYNRDRQGDLTLVETDSDNYVEACRLVRKAGFFKLAQDFHEQSLNNFPEEYLGTDSGSGIYSKYVTDAVTAYEASIGSTNLYEQTPPDFPSPTALEVTFPAADFENAITLPTSSGAESRQLQARGLYVDYLSDELRLAINCLDLGGSGEDCGVPEASSALEIIPFFDVQLTWLARWNESPNNNPVDVSNEAVETDNAHSRGLAQLGSGFGVSTVTSSVHDGNLGLTATDPIDLEYSSHEEATDSFVTALSLDEPPALSTVTITGEITSSVPGVRAVDVEISGDEVQCDRTNTGYECVLELGATNPRILVNNYYKRNSILVACSGELEIQGSEQSNNNWTRFYVPFISVSSANIVIKEDFCG